MGTHGKAGQQERLHNKALKTRILESLSTNIQARPLKDGRIYCLLGNAKEGNIEFVIPHSVVLDAARAAVETYDKLELGNKNAGTETATQPAGG